MAFTNLNSFIAVGNLDTYGKDIMLKLQNFNYFILSLSHLYNLDYTIIKTVISEKFVCKKIISNQWRIKINPMGKETFI